ncbi:MAG: hypothetical protein CMD14_09385 [Flavobacteriales bacterium]|nr:hypothetical protein [Flavobacteriales bacterium]|tara:strand:- start:3166 stop:3435 length:270 start_codon:yes stop_codon:yes gene_type:complete
MGSDSEHDQENINNIGLQTKYNNLQGQYEQSSLQIKSYRLQYMFLFIFLVLVVYLTVRAFTNPFPFFIEYLILIAAIVVMLYHGTKKFI